MWRDGEDGGREGGSLSSFHGGWGGVHRNGKKTTTINKRLQPLLRKTEAYREKIEKGCSIFSSKLKTACSLGEVYLRNLVT